MKKQRGGSPALLPDTPVCDIALVDVEMTEIENALAEFKREVAAGASVGEIGGRLIKKDGSWTVRVRGGSLVDWANLN